MKHDVLDLRPTQMALGMREVQVRAKKLKDMKSSELEDHLKDNVVPIILGKKKRIYIIDRHHLTRACWEAGIEKVHCELKADLSDLSSEDLWKTMNQAKWIYPFDQFGKGPHDIKHMPEDIRGMANDPYRSLAWYVRQEGGFDKVKVPFVEFQWANYFRKHVRTFPSRDHMDESIKEALIVSRRPEAKDLPGYKVLSRM